MKKTPNEGDVYYSAKDPKRISPYSVLFCTNTKIPFEMFKLKQANPIQVVFVSVKDGSIWSKALSEWSKSFIKK